MKKITLLMTARSTAEALRAVRSLGVLHVKVNVAKFSQPGDEIEAKYEATAAATAFLAGIPGVVPQTNGSLAGDTFVYVKEVQRLRQGKDALCEKKQKIERMLAWYEQWGNISLVSLHSLARQGLHLWLYHVPRTRAWEKRIAKDQNSFVVARSRGYMRIAVISPERGEKYRDAQAVKIPDEEYDACCHQQKQLQADIERIDAHLREIATHLVQFRQYQRLLARECELRRVISSGQEHGTLYSLQGFCPRGSAERKLSAAAQKEGWGIIVRDPDENDEPPTLLYNPHWVRSIQPIFRFMGTLPGYKEYDVSFWFLIFFSLFFAMLIGDGGYGLLFLCATFIAHRKLKKIPGEAFFLSYILSFATVAWGAVTGTWFGSEQIARIPFFDFFIISKLDSFAAGNQAFMVLLCFIIGAVHLTIAHGIAAFRFINSPFALAQVGWIGMVWGIFFIAAHLVSGVTIPPYVPALLTAGFVLIMLCSHTEKKLIKGLLISLGDFPLKAVNAFSDIVSYLRLFAVGYATVMLAATVNSLASAFGGKLIAAAILFVGHGINILLGLMSVAVHGLRLNMLEFSSHLDMSWSGTRYEPFRE